MSSAFDQFTGALGDRRGAERAPATGRFAHLDAPVREDAARERVRLVEECLAAEARIAEAHHEGYSRVAQRARALLTDATEKLRAAVRGDERTLTVEHAEQRLHELEAAARDAAALLEAVLDVRTFPAGRRAYLQEQPARLRMLSAGDVPRGYYAMRYLGHAREVLLAERANTQPGA